MVPTSPTKAFNHHTRFFFNLDRIYTTFEKNILNKDKEKGRITILYKLLNQNFGKRIPLIKWNGIMILSLPLQILNEIKYSLPELQSWAINTKTQFLKSYIDGT